MAPLRLLWMWLLVAGIHGVKDGDMRLADGDTANEGRVEIYYSGQWGTVCDNLWDLTDASVVCRALGFENATEALGGATFGPGRGPIMLDEVQCTGTEPSLANCSSLGWMKSNCRHDKDAGVICTNETRGIYTFDLSSELPAALEQIFESQKGCDLFIRVKTKEEGELGICAHKLILSTNPEAHGLWKEPSSRVTMEVDTECVPVVRDFIKFFHLLARKNSQTNSMSWATHTTVSPWASAPARSGGSHPGTMLFGSREQQDPESQVGTETTRARPVELLTALWDPGFRMLPLWPFHCPQQAP